MKFDAANRAEWDNERANYGEEEVTSVTYLCGEVKAPKPCPVEEVNVRALTLEEVAEFEAEKRAAQQVPPFWLVVNAGEQSPMYFRP